MTRRKVRNVLFEFEMNHWDHKARFFKHAMGAFALGSFGCLVLAAPLALIPNPMVHSVSAALIAAAGCFAVMAIACLLVGILFKTMSFAHRVYHKESRLHPADYFNHMTTEFRC